MIAGLSGDVFEKGDTFVVVDVHGVRYQCTVSSFTLADLPGPGESIELYTHTHVREEELSLFGFSSRQEREVFLILISVSGIGPRVAMALLSAARPADLARMVVEADLAALTRLPGVGKKTAERMVVELQDKLAKKLAMLPGDSVTSKHLKHHRELHSALLNLGFKARAVESAIEDLEKKHASDAPLELLIREALAELAKR